MKTDIFLKYFPYHIHLYLCQISRFNTFTVSARDAYSLMAFGLAALWPNGLKLGKQAIFPC